MAVSQSQKEKREFFESLYALDDMASEESDGPGFTPPSRKDHVPFLSERKGHGECHPYHAENSKGDKKGPSEQNLFTQAVDKTPKAIKRPVSSPLRASPGRAKIARPSMLRRTKSDLPAHSSGKDDIASSPKADQHSSSRSGKVQGLETTGSLEKQQASGPVNLTHARVTPAVPRRKGKSPERPRLPDDRQIFKGLIFFFVPNNDDCPVRRLRIRIAIQHGAIWVKEWSEHVTHVIVTNDLDVKESTKVFPDRRIPEGALLVKDKWLTYCVGERFRHATHHNRFQVPGMQALIAERKAKKCDNSITPTAQKPLSGQLVEVGQSSANKESQGIPRSNGVRRPISPTNELENIMLEIRDVEKLPLDLITSEEEMSSNDELFLEPLIINQSDPKENQGFLCMQEHAKVESSNPNARTIDLLQQMAAVYARLGDRWRMTGYRKGISALRKETALVRTKEQARAIPNIGESLAEKIEEIVTTDRLRKLKFTELDPTDQTLQLFMGVYGAGYATAQRWIAQGHRSLQDLSTRAELTFSQRVGVQHYDDFLQRIPRKEVAGHGEVVAKALKAADKELVMTIAGSYRRGVLDSSDIDILVTKRDATVGYIRTVMIEIVIPDLTKKGFLKAALATSHSSGHGSKWHGASALPGINIWRRIDFLFVPWLERGAALIYFTGNDIFNRSIRLLASRKNMRLNQHGLYTDALRGHGSERLTEGKLVESESEERIFKILGVPWRPPEHREC